MRRTAPGLRGVNVNVESAAWGSVAGLMVGSGVGYLVGEDHGARAGALVGAVGLGALGAQESKTFQSHTSLGAFTLWIAAVSLAGATPGAIVGGLVGGSKGARVGAGLGAGALLLTLYFPGFSRNP
jgi:hypothetical protein